MNMNKAGVGLGVARYAPTDNFGFTRLALGFSSLLLVVLVACTPAQPSATVLPTLPPLVGTVDISYPENGTVIYAEALYLAGSAEDIPAEGFRIEVMSALDEIIAQTTIQPEDGHWSVELVHDYTGDPTEITILALPSDAGSAQDYALVTAVLSSIEHRPEGTYGSIFLPEANALVGGDQLQVIGTGSGLFENTLLLSLISSNGTIIDEQILTLNNPYFVDEVVWSVDMLTQGKTGPATIRAYYQDARDGEEITLDSIDVMLSAVAG